MVTFCKFSQKYFIRSVFFLSSTGDNLSPLHRPNSCPRRPPSAPRPCPPPRALARLPAAGNPAPTQPPSRLTPAPTASTPARQFQPPLFPPRPNGNAKKNYKPTHLSRFRTRIALGRARSTCASAHARRNIRAARSGCARPRRRVYNISAGLAAYCFLAVG